MHKTAIVIAIVFFAIGFAGGHSVWEENNGNRFNYAFKMGMYSLAVGVVFYALFFTEGEAY